LPEVLSSDQMIASYDYFIMQIGAEVSFGFIRQCNILNHQGFFLKSLQALRNLIGALPIAA
jgi:hypothetical protein